MRLRPLMGGMVLSASLPMMGIATSPPAPSQADVNISVDAAASCLWYMENLPSVINMSSATKYRGDPLVVSATISPAIGFSGDPEDPGYSAPCSFFNSSFTTKKMRVAIDSSQFDATYGGTGDESLSFGLDERALSVQVSKVDQQCQDVTGMPLTVPSNFGWGRNKSAASTALDVVAYSDVPDYGVKNFFASGNSAKCAPELEFEVEISSAQSGPPAGAGQTYVFTGPSLTFSMDTVANNFASAGAQSLSAFGDLVPNPSANLTDRWTPDRQQEMFRFAVDSSERIYTGSLYGTPAEFRAIPTSATWFFNRPTWTKTERNYGFNIQRSFGFCTSGGNARNKFNGGVTVYYQIDYRYPGTDWVIRAANGNRTSFLPQTYLAC